MDSLTRVLLTLKVVCWKLNFTEAFAPENMTLWVERL